MATRHEQNGKRRFFGAEFKLEAVRRMQERRAGGASLSQVGRELGVRPDMLRAWAKQAEGRPGGGGARHLPGARAPADRAGGAPAAAAGERRVAAGGRVPKKAAAYFAKESR